MFDFIEDLIQGAAEKIDELLSDSNPSDDSISDDSSSMSEDSSSLFDGLSSISPMSSSISDSCTTNFDDSFLNDNETPSEDNISFTGKDTKPNGADKDGFIPNGSVKLKSTISDKKEEFKVYKKDGEQYALYNGGYKKISGSGSVNIGGVKFDKIGSSSKK